MRSHSASSRSRPSLSVVVVSHNEGDHLAATVHALLATMPRDGELLVVDDQSTDGSCDGLLDRFPHVRLIRPPTRQGVAGARNFGAARASAPVFLFSDAHVQPEPGWVEALLPPICQPRAGVVAPAVAALDDPEACGYGMTWRDTALNVDWLPYRGAQPYPVPFVAGMFIAVRRDVFRACGGFDPGLVGWGSEDIELCLRLWALGYDCVIAPRARVAHLFRPRFPYTVDPVAVMHNLLRTALIHLSRRSLGRVFAALAGSTCFAPALAWTVDGDAAARRTALADRRRRDDRWLCTEFDIKPLRTDPEESPT
jgi:glycosyltransferase involved in cell wall biosynthesis